jgi:hypothetical protein
MKMDQCKHCTLRGNLIACKKEPCSHHENWYAIEQQKEINNADTLLEKALHVARDRLIGTTNKEHDEVFNEILIYLDGKYPDSKLI